MNFQNEHARFGSAGFSDEYAMRKAGLFNRTSDACLLGFHNVRPLYFGGQGGNVTIAGARTGKLACAISYTALGASWDHDLAFLDVKGEIYSISEYALSLSGRAVIPWCPLPLPGVPQGMNVNPVDYIRRDSPTKIADIMRFVAQWCPIVAQGDNVFWERQRQRYLVALCIAITERDGVLSIPALYEAVTLITTYSEQWNRRVGYYLHACEGVNLVRVDGEEINDVNQVEKEIRAGHDNPDDRVFRSIVAELTGAFACLIDPNLMQSVSPHPDGSYDFSFSYLGGSQRYAVFFCVPQDCIEAWGPVVRAMFTAAKVYKSRRPSSRPQLHVLDEAGNIGAFPQIVELYTIGAGLGIKPWAIFQSTDQINGLAPNAKNRLLSSAQTQQWFGVRDLETSTMLSHMIGSETLQYYDRHAVERAEHEKRSAMLSMLNGGDPIHAMQQMTHHTRMAETPQVQQRMVRNPDEIRSTPKDLQYIFTDLTDLPIVCEKRPYYEQSFIASRHPYLPNPYFPPAGKVRVKTAFGFKWRPVITEPVPPRYRHLPQYRHGTWRKVAS